MFALNQLLGFWATTVSVAAPLTTVSLVGSAVANAATITEPGVAVVGDLLVYFDQSYTDAGAVALNFPAGFTQFTNAMSANVNARAATAWKIAEAGDLSASLSGMDGTTENKVLLIFHGNVPITSVTSSTWNQQNTSGNPALQNVSASGQAVPLIVLTMVSTRGAADIFNASTTPAFDAEVATANTNMKTRYKIYDSAPANHAIDVDDSAGSGQTAFMSGYAILT